MAKPAGKKKKGLSIDFTGVESGGSRVPDGNYTAKIDDVEQKEGQDSGQPYLNFKWKITSKASRGAVVYDNVSLQPQALWRFKNLLEALGTEVPDGAMDIDTADLIGEECDIEITNEKYNGKDQPRITAYGASSESSDDDEKEDEDEEEEDEEEEEEKGKDKKSKDDEDDEEEEEEEKEKPSSKKKKTASSTKLKVGTKVKFKDDDGKTVKGVVTAVDGSTVTVEDSDDEEWEVEADEVTPL